MTTTTEQTEVPPATAATDPVSTADAVPPDTSLRITGEQASRLLLSSRWQQ